MPDATGLELIAQELRDAYANAAANANPAANANAAANANPNAAANANPNAESIVDTSFHRDRATLIVNPSHITGVLERLRAKGYSTLASLHGVDYYPEEPRLGVLYELLDMNTVDRITVKARLHTDAAKIDSVVGLFPGADFPEREVYDMFGVVFEGHPDLRRILMPEDYEGFPQRRDFPVGGEPVLFTHNEEQSYGKWQ